MQQEAPEIVNAMLLAWLAGDPVPEAGDVVVDRVELLSDAVTPFFGPLCQTPRVINLKGELQ